MPVPNALQIMPTPIHYSSQDGLDLFAAEYGPKDAPLTVLCMHGLTRNHKDFEPMIAGLGTSYRFISVDVRGRGQSDRSADSADYTPAVYARDMMDLLDTLGVNRTVLIGTSMGDLMAMIMAKMQKDRIAGIVLNDVGPELNQTGLDRIASYVSDVEPLPGWDEAAKAVASAQSSVFPHYTKDDWMAFARRTYRTNDKGGVILDYDPAITRGVADAKPSRVATFAAWRLFGAMKRIPLLIVRGETSDILSQHVVDRMLRRHKDASAVTVPAVGHAPMLDETVALGAIRTFLDRLAGAH